jgi:hypothetical protein
MSDEIFWDKKNPLEEAFFAAENEKLRQRLLAANEEKSQREALSAASGISDDAALNRLVSLNIRSDTLAALSVAPLVLVAWADGSIDDGERNAVLAGAESAGIGRQSVPYQLLEGWLTTPPSRDLLPAWTDYILAVSARLDVGDRQVLMAELLGRARRVAEVTGGFLGLGQKVSTAEEAVLAKLQGAFSAEPVIGRSTAPE